MIERSVNNILKMNLPIDFIAPSHGLVWRKDINEVIEKYSNHKSFHKRYK